MAWVKFSIPTAVLLGVGRGTIGKKFRRLPGLGSRDSGGTPQAEEASSRGGQEPHPQDKETVQPRAPQAEAPTAG